MDLPTYTNIWRIEKRLYKLYDVRLPAPLPINWIIVFTGITVPYILLLIAIGLPFNHSLVWLYVLPPGLLTWLTTRPVIEGKRLPELLESQIRYVAEPRVWCRMAPLGEKGQMTVSGRVWHSRRQPAERVAGRAPSMTALLERGSMARRKAGVPLRPAGVPALASPAPDALATGASTDATLAAMAAAGGTAGVAARGASNGAARNGAAKNGTAKNGTVKDRGRKRRPSRGSGAKRGAARGNSAGGAADQAAAGGRRSVSALASGQAAPAPPLPSYGSAREPVVLGMAPLRPAAAPVLATMPAHATPSLAPVPSVPAAPMAPQPATQAPTRAVAPAVPPPAAAAAPPAERPGTQVRARGTAGGQGRIEVTHSGPAQRPVPSAPPPDPARAWPAVAPARPLPPVTEPPAGVAPTAATGGETPSEPPADRKPPRRELFSLLASTTPPGDSPGKARLTSGPQNWRLVSPGPAAPPVTAVPPEAPAPEAPAPETPASALVSEPASPPAAERMPAAEAPAAEAAAVVASAPPAPVAAPPPALANDAPVPAAQAAAAPATARNGTAERGNGTAEPGVERERQPIVPSIERAMSGPSRDRNLSWHTKVKIVAGAGQGPGARDQEALDRARARLPLKDPKRVLVLGCTSGAGQTVTAMMTGHILAGLREEPVAAVDLHDGTLARYTAPAALLREVLDGARPQGQSSAHPDGLPPRPRTERNRAQSQARLDVIASDDPLRDGDERLLAEHLGRHYTLTIVDPGATGLTRLLKITDQLVIVAPASVEAASALADTRDWLDAHGFAELAMHSVTLVNGVSRSSLPDVEAAEAVARGRCRAIVRVPWDDMLPMGDAGPSTLHPQTRVAYSALAGVLVAGMAAAPVRRPQ